MAKKNETLSISFFSFLKAKEQRLDWVILLVSCIVGYVILKICYPYPATISDSGTYVNAAMNDMFTFYRPFGYSVYLQIVHALSPSINAIFVTQILLYFLACASFSFVIKYLYAPACKVIWFALLFLFVFSPIAFYMSNAIMSDLLFAVMIYFMLSAFFYFFKTKSWIALCLFLVSLFFTLQIRYSALMFPVLFIICFFFVKSNLRWVGIVGTLVVTLIFYNQVKSDMRETTGFNQFSTGFDGWQLANNAMHVIPYIDLPPERIVNPELGAVHSFVVAQKDMIYDKIERGKEVSASFMWANDQPLKQFMFAYIQHTQQPYPVAWIRLGSTTYKDYGAYLITRYPGKFIQYYILPNSKRIFYVSSKEIIGKYTPIEVKDIFQWYNIPEGTNVEAKHTLFESFVAEASASSYLVLWPVVFILGIVSFVMRKKLSWQDSSQKKIFWIVVVVGVLYYAATIFASPVSLRFWIPMNAVIFALIYIMVNRILAYKKHEKKDLSI